MRTMIAGLLILTTALIQTADVTHAAEAEEEQGWRDVTTRDLYRVQMPGLILSEQRADLKARNKVLGGIEYYLFNDVKNLIAISGSYNEKAGFAPYGLTYSEYFPAKVKFKSAQQLLEAARAQCLKESITLVNPGTEIKIDGHPGYQMEFDTTTIQGTTIRKTVRLYVVKNRVYRLSFSGTGTPDDDANRQRFFDSFELVND